MSESPKAKKVCAMSLLKNSPKKKILGEQYNK